MKHYRSKHEDVKYPCIQVGYQDTEKGDLKKHIQSKHEVIKYPCNHFEQLLNSNNHRSI